MTFIFFDLDEFKLINDHYGHQEGDFVLIEFTQTMQKTFRESDILGRLGGDEFVMMLSDTGMDEVNALLNRFNEAVIEMNLRFNKPYSIKFSAGAVSFPYDTRLSLDDMIAKADIDNVCT